MFFLIIIRSVSSQVFLLIYRFSLSIKGIINNLHIKWVQPHVQLKNNLKTQEEEDSQRHNQMT